MAADTACDVTCVGGVGGAEGCRAGGSDPGGIHGGAKTAPGQTANCGRELACTVWKWRSLLWCDTCVDLTAWE
eukprot:7572153-Pyramimonas_sp.AAC.1